LLEFGKPVGPILKFQFLLAEKIVFKKLRNKIGANLRFISKATINIFVYLIPLLKPFSIWRSCCEFDRFAVF
jgi:hypothetical protein